MTRDNPCSRSVSRRDVLRWLSAGAVGGVFLPPTALAAPFLQSGGARRITFPPGAVIRTILQDVAPGAITGPTLFHEHMSLSKAYWVGPDARRHDTRSAPAAERAPRRNLLPRGPRPHRPRDARGQRGWD